MIIKIEELLKIIETDLPSMKPKIIAQDYDIDNELNIFMTIAKKMYGGSFVIDKFNTESIMNLIRYFNDDKEVENYGISLCKGIIIAGKIGSGKTDLLQVFSQYCKIRRRSKFFIIVSVEEITDNFSKNGQKGIDRYMKNHVVNNYSVEQSKPRIYCIDDLGLEKKELMYFGEKEDVIGKILYERYNLFKMGILTHATTNLAPDELYQRYNNRIYSRIKEMFNWIVLEGNDRRK